MTNVTLKRLDVITVRTPCVLILFALMAVRLTGLHFSVVDLFYDEAQYWLWSRDPAWGYFSKPPLLAWVIGLTVKVCGNGEACVRAAAPIFYFGTSLLSFAVANLLYGERTAVWTASVVTLSIGVSFSSRIISTDVPLLFFWTLALLAYFKLLLGGPFSWAAVLGLAIGLGLQAKYAMAYFLLGIPLAALIDDGAKRLFWRPALWFSFAIACILIAPNVVWNVMNGFVTFKHTGANIQGDGFAFSMLKGIQFIALQFLVIGPIVFGLLLVVIARIPRRDLLRQDRLLLCFSIVPLAIVTVVAFVRGADENWAAPAFIPAAVIATAIMVRRSLWGWLAVSLSIGIVVQAVLIIGDATANRLTLPALGKDADIYRRTMLGRPLGEAIGNLARHAAAPTVVSEEYYELALLFYYLRGENLRLFLWPVGTGPKTHYDLNYSATEDVTTPILFVSQCPAVMRLEEYYRVVVPLGQLEVRTGPTSNRLYFAFKLDVPRGAIGQLSKCKWAPPQKIKPI
jgi:4-amino-4-deoxy-L-arabinose transferase-like glycosyltransferase